MAIHAFKTFALQGVVVVVLNGSGAGFVQVGTLSRWRSLAAPLLHTSRARSTKILKILPVGHVFPAKVPDECREVPQGMPFLGESPRLSNRVTRTFIQELPRLPDTHHLKRLDIWEFPRF